jgi:hypothetical protein
MQSGAEAAETARPSRVAAPLAGGLGRCKVTVPSCIFYQPFTPRRYRLTAARRFGVMVERLTSIPGVLAYQRDQVIDARSGAPVTGRD